MRFGGGMFDRHEFGKRVRRLLDGNYSYRKILVLLIIFGSLILYLGPSIAQWLFSTRREPIEAYNDHCINEKLAGYYFDALDYNVNILSSPPKKDENKYLPYVGNGIFGIPIQNEAWIYVKSGRTLSLPVKWQPLIIYQIPQDAIYREASVTDYTKGIVFKYQCFRDGYQISYQYYAHRLHEGIFVQEIKFSNPMSVSHEFPLRSQVTNYWTDSHLETIYMYIKGTKQEFNLASGYITVPNSNKVIAVAIVYQSIPKFIEVKARDSFKIEYFTSINYSEPVIMDQFSKERDSVKNRAVAAMQKILDDRIHKKNLKQDHIKTWQQYWNSGFRISDSKAKDAINGYKINSTIYYILSQTSKGLPDIEKNVKNNEGCYRGHHTLDATRLWTDTSTIDTINELVNSWFITIEKQGCEKLLKGGPSAVLQAIVLSLGGLRFSSQHLEFNVEPSNLHRDFLFRRISYGNVTHLNISVTVNEENRAVLAVALDRSDSIYYGCDAGCLDPPVPLGQSYIKFPVKLTKPLTAILYITSDYQHMQELQSALHLRSIDEAPAHTHDIMAIHKHGHQLGGLPTFFWVSICFLIVIFHLFLCKLIVSEYWDTKGRGKVRYNKL
ncbi:hypothetical protein TKK_0017454 [Trichogramma kaykai]|uniref:Uncharacterized protein n=1 Tax=Trichogramma kaykai TaxID=54128 RepID=A0ABD2W4I2_9HYME